MTESKQIILLELNGERLGSIALREDDSIQVDLPEPHRQKIIELVEQLSVTGITDFGEVTAKQPIPVAPRFLLSELWPRLQRLGFKVSAGKAD